MKNPKLFLVTGTVYKTWYMEENPKKTDEISIVWADSADEARSKFEQHFDSLTQEYTVYYSVSNVVAREAIS